MYLRKKNTRTTDVLQLVESYRDHEGRPRQRVLLSLGDASIPNELWKEIARGVESKLSGQQGLFDLEPSVEAVSWIDRIVRQLEASGCGRKPEAAAANPAKSVEKEADKAIDGVLIDEVTHGNSTPLGPSLAALHAWNELKLPEFLDDLSFNTSQKKALTINVINRIVDPVSENALAAWQFDTSLPELLGRESLPTTNDRFYRACDQILTHKDKLSAHLREQEASYFALDRTIVLYDLTNTYFEGSMQHNRKAKRGKSKEKRNDCPQLVVGMAFDQQGFELGHEVFEGNKNDARSMVDMVHRLSAMVEPADDNQKPLIIIDGGIASRENRELLQNAGMDFLANDSRPGRNKYAEWFADDSAFTEVKGREQKEPVYVRMIKDPLADDEEIADTLILCKSAGRSDKEQAILSKAEERFLSALEKLKNRVDAGRLKVAEKIQQKIGALLTRHPRVARYYTVEYCEAKGVTCQRKDHDIEGAKGVQGCYVLRTSSSRLADAEDWWKIYIMLTRAEDGFRALKSDLGLRPIRHHREDRGDSHILISVMAYHLLHFITHRLRSQGDCRSWETIKRILSTHCYTTVNLPTSNGVVHNLRSPGQPDARQMEIYQALNINWKNLPKTHLIN